MDYSSNGSSNVRFLGNVNQVKNVQDQIFERAKNKQQNAKYKGKKGSLKNTKTTSK